MKLSNLIQKSKLSNASTSDNKFERKLYTGLGDIKIIEINPTLAMFDSEYMKDFSYMKPQTEPEYSLMKDGEKIGTKFSVYYKAVMPDVEITKKVNGEDVVETEEVDCKGRFDIIVMNKYRISNDQSKIEITNRYGDTTWTTYSYDEETGEFTFNEPTSPYYKFEDVKALRAGELALHDLLYIITALKEHDISVPRKNVKIEENNRQLSINGQPEADLLQSYGIWSVVPEGFDSVLEEEDFSYYHDVTEKLREIEETGGANLVKVAFMIRDNKYQEVFGRKFGLPGAMTYKKNGVVTLASSAKGIIKELTNAVEYSESVGKPFSYADLSGEFKKWNGENESNQEAVNTKSNKALPVMPKAKPIMGGMPKNNMLPKKQ